MPRHKNQIPGVLPQNASGLGATHQTTCHHPSQVHKVESLQSSHKTTWQDTIPSSAELAVWTTMVLEFGERLDLVLWETCHIYATCQAYRAEADFQHMGAMSLESPCI